MKKNILVFIDWYVPGYKAGGPIRSCANMIAALKDDYNFWVVTRDSDYTSDEKYPDILSDQWQLGPFGEQVYYFSSKQLNRRNMRQLMQDTAFDVVYINGIYSFYFSITPLILSRRLSNKKIIVGTRGMLAPSAIDVKRVKKKLFLNLSKFAGIYRNVIFHVTNEKEEKDVQIAIHDKVNTFIADNFPLSGNVLTERKSTKKSGELSIISLARISPEKNLHFALEILQQCTSGAIKFDVYGPVYDKPYFQKCEALAAELPANITINFMGSVAPEATSQLFRNADLFFMPTLGENFGHSISESLMNGTPVLISDQTPWSAINTTQAGKALSLNNKTPWINYINELVHLSGEDYQKLIDESIKLSLEKNNTPSLKMRYRELFA